MSRRNLCWGLIASGLGMISIASVGWAEVTDVRSSEHVTPPAAVVQPTTDTDHGPGCAFGKAVAAKFLREHGVETTAPPTESPTGFDTATDVLHYTLDIEIDLANKWIGGSNLMKVRVVDPVIDTFQIRISDAFAIPTIRVNGAPVTSARIDKATIEVTLDRSYRVGEEFDLYLEYSGKPYSDGFGSIEFTTHNGYRVAWTLSESWYAYTWWPCKDVNTDKSTADLYFTVSNDIVVASQGTVMGVRDLGNGKHQFHWKTNYPTATYLYSFAATNYNQFDEVFNYGNYSMPVSFFVYPESDTSHNRDLLRKTVDMLRVYSDQYGLYPFIDEKYGVVQFSWGGGMEHQTMTSQSSFSEWLSAHEEAHEWWGDMITCATWHDIWLNEGFASYSEAIWEEFKNGEDRQALLNYMNGLRPSRVDGSVYVYDDSNLNRIFSSNFSYRKAAWVLHMLRHVIGDSNFFDTLSIYRNDYEYGSAITDEFIAEAEGVWGDDLSWFFDAWIYDIGAPAYQYGWSQSTVNGRTFVELYLKQVQSNSYPTFPMPIDVRTTVGSVNTTDVLWNDERAEHLLFEVAQPVDNLTLDPEAWVLATSSNRISFTDGPPKVISIDPMTNGKGHTRGIDVEFHKDVIASAQDFGLMGNTVGPVPFTFEYDQASYTARIIPDGALPTDTYVFTVYDTVTDVRSGQSLDGELDAFRWVGEAVFPSGDGVAGGDTAVQFDVVYRGPRSRDQSGKVDVIAVYPWP